MDSRVLKGIRLSLFKGLRRAGWESLFIVAGVLICQTWLASNWWFIVGFILSDTSRRIWKLLKKGTLVVLVTSFMFACSDECDEIKSEYKALKHQLEIANTEVERLEVALSELDPTDPEQLSEYQFAEDQLLMELIEVADLEIQIETHEKHYSRCL